MRGKKEDWDWYKKPDNIDPPIEDVQCERCQLKAENALEDCEECHLTLCTLCMMDHNDELNSEET